MRQLAAELLRSLSDHTVEFVATVADRLVVMDRGQIIITEGPVDRVIADERVQQAYFGALR